MVLTSLQYEFRQSFSVPAASAYDWCTDSRSSDGRLFPVKWRRGVRRLTKDALILTDTTYPEGKIRRIHRLVRLYPSQLAWSNTHTDGPFRHSQYWYQIHADGPRRSHLVFRGLRLISTPRKLSASETKRLTKAERNGDAALWRTRLAPALEKEVARAR